MSLRDEIEAGTLTLRWRTVGDARVCAEPVGGCRARHDQGGKTLDEWQAEGLPGTGWSACQGRCRCLLIPEGLLAVGAKVLDPVDIKKALDSVPDVSDPVEQARIASNRLLLPSMRPGQTVIYQGRVLPQMRGERAVILSTPRPSAVGGLFVAFEAPPEGIVEFGTTRVWDFTELVVVSGGG